MNESGQVSLIRGINVGGHAPVPMTRLRAIYEALGVEDVRTHLQSGNVAYRSDRLPDDIATQAEASLQEEFGLPIRVLGRRASDLARIVADNPFPDTDPSRHVVVFLSAAPPADARARLERLAATGETVHVGEREIQIHYPQGMGGSKVSPAVLERNGLVATARNWRTVTRLLELASQDR
jgi:uncharacterized protein (DUF1697 family)